MTQTTEKFDQWCIVEVFGHQRIAGRVTEQAIGGCNFVRVDVPEIAGKPAFTKLFGNGAIYAMSPVSEAVTMAVANQIRVVPVSAYEIPELQKLAAQANSDDAEFNDDLGF